ncbi:MAG: glycerophosphodiester phosphodiesterase [Clostridia bacterium]|nr:glycerophosphodiester phosphodiesterase [Clostridia bacterium]
MVERRNAERTADRVIWWLLIAPMLAAAYLFLIAPNLRRRFRPKAQGLCRAFAHRGLHGAGVPENSLAAFQLAAEKGYGVELDVRLTRDQRLVVLHDADIGRMTDGQGLVGDLTLKETQAHHLLGTQERIPSFDEALAVLAPHKTPLIVELKSAPGTGSSMPQMVLERLRKYPGFWCVESFDPRLMRWFKKHAPEVIRGQLAYDARRAGEDGRTILHALGAHLITSLLSRPDFVAYRFDTDRNPSFRLVKSLFRPTLAAWTVTAIQDFKRLLDRYDLLIFEGFEPYNQEKNQEKEKEP